ncbi:hypothetical protein LOTGIDRAFT_159936 [Lottia gigantea]|uniref:Alpha-carbonic anhydrase domain-containing protein n=1 Tax=Lottia gigantea TaxID=225164 RepID=V4AP03_LOTGI|nr:hypothetical protein LOTGIDRAFT_159936 [Lottia gigantea]ESO96520.1 hypothetical protein LOTGIDRAFT_159936 [Lottia gigantea]
MLKIRFLFIILLVPIVLVEVSTLHDNRSITVKYLGDKFHPLCANLNCQRVDIVPMGTVQKKELVDPNGWSSFQSFMVPFAGGPEPHKFSPSTRASASSKSDLNLSQRFELPGGAMMFHYKEHTGTNIWP